MRVRVERYGHGPRSTLGRLSVDGRPECFTLEDRTRIGPKVAGETAIPVGVYPVRFKRVGGFHSRYSARFPGMHRGMLRIEDVPGFSEILIHCGNDHEDTRGCVLVGASPVATNGGDFEVRGSEVAYRGFYPLVAGALERGEDVQLEVAQRW